MKQIYLDYAAATPVDERVLAAAQPFFGAQFYNPSATYLKSRAVKQELDVARAMVAHWLGVKPTEVVFTAGGTEANNLAIRGVLEQYPDGNVVVSAIEHESVLEPAGRYDCRTAAALPDGTVDLVSLANTVDDQTVLVSVMYANNEIGTIQPIRKIAEIIKRKRAERSGALPLYFHTDAAQAANYLDLHAARLGVDLMTINGGKIYGFKQSGAMYVRAGLELAPLILGGGQERGRRNGTENVAACAGLAVALELAQSGRRDEATRLAELQRLFIDQLKAQIPIVKINGSLKHRLPNNVHITLPGQDNERIIMMLDAAGIMAATGSACSASSEEPSHVLGAIGLSEAEARASLRFTMGRTTTKADVERTVKTLASLIA